ncbi:MAG: GNAT family N-acetyltransferase [Glycocaulis sp.]
MELRVDRQNTLTSVETVRPEKLGDEARAAWRAFQAADPALASPYFSLGFLDAMAASRRDTSVAVLREEGKITAFLPFHRGVMGHARPLGGPLGDHHGYIAAQGTRIHLPSFLKAAGIGALDFHGALGSQTSFQPHAREIDGSWVMDLSAGFDAYVASRTAMESKAFRNLRARRRKLEQAAEGFTVRVHDTRPHVLETALEWKSAQYRRTGHFDVFSVGWTNDLIRNLVAGGLDNASGAVSSLEIGGELAAIHVGMRSERVLHYWFPVYDPAFAVFGPGLALLMEIAEALSQDGVNEIHLGPGEYSFKAELASWQFPVLTGFAAAPSLAGVARGLADSVERSAERLPLGALSKLPGKAFRRLDRHAAFRAA